MKKTEREIIKSVVVDAPPSLVFKALTDEKELPNWFPNAGAQVEPRVGGKIVLKTRRPDTGEINTIVGRVLEFVPDLKFSHSWSPEGVSDAESVVTWTLESVENNSKTKVTLVHSGQAADKLGDTDRGWTFFTGRLVQYCKQERPIIKTIVIDAPREQVFSAITDPSELTRWFPDQVVLEPVRGGLVQFRFLEHGCENHTVEGRIIEIVPNEKLVYSWKNLSDAEFPDSVVSWTLESVGKKTKVTLTHSGLTGKRFDLHNQGWTYFVNRLQRLLQGEPLEDKEFARERGDLPKPN